MTIFTSPPFYKAGWSNKLLGMTVFVLAMLGFGAYQMFVNGVYWGILLLLAIVGVSLAIGVRGYSITAETIVVHRYGWETKFPLATLVSAEIDPNAMKRSIRTFGNGGLFGFIGRFRNKHLGSYTAYVTNALNSVVLRYPDKTIVISPDNPAVFVEQLHAQHPHLQSLSPIG